MNNLEKSQYESHQAGYLSADIFFYGDEKPTDLHEMPFEGTIGTTEVIFISPMADDNSLEAARPDVYARKKASDQAFRVVFSNPAVSGVEYRREPKPTYLGLFSHCH